MPGLIWSSKGEVLSGGAGVPDGSADGQFLLWNAAAGEWQAQSVTPGDIGAAAAAHTHDWADIASVGSFATGFAADGRVLVYHGTPKDIAYMQEYSGGVLLLVEDWYPFPTSERHSSIWMLQRSTSDVYTHQIAGSAAGTVSIESGTPYIVRYAAPVNKGVRLYYLFLPFGVR
jgi:hypothetical protein